MHGNLRETVQSHLIGPRAKWTRRAFGRAASDVLAVPWNSTGEAVFKWNRFSLRADDVSGERRQTSSSGQARRWNTSSDSRGPLGGRLPTVSLGNCLQILGGFESPLAVVRRKLTGVRLRVNVRLRSRLRRLSWWWESSSRITS